METAVSKKTEWLVALAGNPNSGKTTVFNALTGTRQHTGNYPGVTVEKKEGVCREDGRVLRIVDLPGVYSLTAYSEEELVARHFLLQERPDVVVDVVDASNLERHLYLAVQLMEMKVPLVLAFTMSDLARQRGLAFDLEQLSRLLGAPIVPLVATRGEGIEELKRTIVRCAEQVCPFPVEIHYGPELEEAIQKMEAVLAEDHPLVRSYGRRWTALKLIEGDSEIQEQIRSPQVADTLHQIRQHLATVFKESPEVLIAERRYGFISGACQETVRQTVLQRHDVSDRMDAVLTHRYLGLPIFAVLMYLVFYLTFQIGGWPQGWLEEGFAFLARLV